MPDEYHVTLSPEDIARLADPSVVDFDDLREKKRPPKPTTAEELAARLGIEVPPMVDISKYPPWLLKAAKKAVDQTFKQDYWKEIIDASGGDIKSVIEDAIEEGLSMRDVADELEAKFGDEYCKMRGMRIARTEVGNAQNAGAVASIDQVREDTGFDIRASWLSVLGSTTRPEHADMDGQTADAEGMFEMDWDGDTYRIPWPGHWSLPAGARINCQCALISDVVGQGLNGGEEERAVVVATKYSEDQPRDESGRWTSGGGVAGSESSVVTEGETHTADDKAEFDKIVADWEKYKDLRKAAGWEKDWDEKIKPKLDAAKHIDKLREKLKRQQGSVKALLTKHQKLGDQLCELENKRNRLAEILKENPINPGTGESQADIYKANIESIEKEIVELAPKIDAAFVTWQKAYTASRDRMVESVRTAIKERMADKLEPASRVLMSVQDETVKQVNGEAIGKAESLLKGCVTEKVDWRATTCAVSKTDEKWYGGNRAYFQAASQPNLGTMHLPPSRSVGEDTVIHEFGHCLEQDSKVAVLARSFLWHRVGEEKPYSMKEKFPQDGFEAHEAGRDDEFGKAFGSSAGYVGKHYTGPYTEIMSMGLEKLFDNPRTFSEKDPEYFKFVVGVLDGSLL